MGPIVQILNKYWLTNLSYSLLRSVYPRWLSVMHHCWKGADSPDVWIKSLERLPHSALCTGLHLARGMKERMLALEPTTQKYSKAEDWRSNCLYCISVGSAATFVMVVHFAGITWSNPVMKLKRFEINILQDVDIMNAHANNYIA